MNKTGINPLTRMDYPDPDIIRVGDVYYMVSTTMHFMPGCEILRSYDLAEWEHASYVYDTLDGTDGQRLTNGADIYGKGMWAASLRYHNSRFYVCFCANDTGKTYLYTASSVEGPWKKQFIRGFYHDNSLLFDDDGRVFIAYGHRVIRITELAPDLSGPLEGGLDRVAVVEPGKGNLGFEGAHFYKINGRYYLFLIHSLEDRWMRTEACFSADSIEGEFTGGNVLVDDMGYCGQGVAQGGIVDTPDGDWYAVLFQDSGAVGRMPVLVPVSFDGVNPVFGTDGKVSRVFSVKDAKPGYVYEPLAGSDDFRTAAVENSVENTGEKTVENAVENKTVEKSVGNSVEKTDKPGRALRYDSFGFRSRWQFNHEPDLSLVRRDGESGALYITSGAVSGDLTQVKNILTQRMCWPGCTGEITVDTSQLREGDCAGICAFQSEYGLIGVVLRNGARRITVRRAQFERRNGRESGRTVTEWLSEPLTAETVRLRIDADFMNMKDEARFAYCTGGEWILTEPVLRMHYRLDHFTGYRFGLFLHSSEKAGGTACFRDFVYRENAVPTSAILCVDTKKPI